MARNLTLAQSVRTFDWWKSWFMIFLGCTILAAGFVYFINPYNIVPGGVYGTSVVLHNLFPNIQVGTFGYMLDVPLMLLSIIIFGGGFGARTVVAALTTPGIMNIMTYLSYDDITKQSPATLLDGKIDLSNDIMLASICGAVLIGVGVGLVVRNQATTGGTDIVAMILQKYFKIKFSNGILLVDSMVVIFGIIVLQDWKLPLYSLITIYISTRLIDYVIDGASYDKLLFINTDGKHTDELRSLIINDIKRGGTYIKASGMYSGAEKEMIFLVVSRNQVVSVQNQIKKIDPRAFLVVVDAYDTYGEGFKPFPEEEAISTN